MALEETRFTIMALPQSVDAAGVLTLNIVFIPRNISPLDEMNSIYGVGNKAKPFVKVQPQFEIKIVNNPDEFPGKVVADEKVYPQYLRLFIQPLQKIFIPRCGMQKMAAATQNILI